MLLSRIEIRQDGVKVVIVVGILALFLTLKGVFLTFYYYAGSCEVWVYTLQQIKKLC
jgi:hypothetical protein